MTFRRLLLRSGGRIKAAAKAWFAPVLARLKDHRLEYALLLIALIFGTLYFSWGAFDEHSYGFGDQYVHHQWIHGLVEGNAFYNGIYPEGMHCMIYLTCTLFHIRLYSGVLFFAGLHVHVLLISAWLLMKEFFHWKYTPLAALAMFLCYDQLCIDEIFGMSRLSWTLPMEYALYTAFLSMLFLLNFLKRVMRGERVKLHPLRPKQWGVLHDEDLFLFSGAVAVSLAVHFYVTIVAFFFCAVTVLVYIRQVFRRGSFMPLAAAVMLSLLVAAGPMVLAFATGIPLQGSLYWAMSVVEGEELNAIPSDRLEQQDNSDGTDEGSDADTNETAGNAVSGSYNGSATVSPDDESAIEAAETPPEPQKSLPARVKEKAAALYWSGYNTLYPGRRSIAILISTVFALAVTLAARPMLALYERRMRRRTEPDREVPIIRDRFDGMLIAAVLSVVLMIMYCPGIFGLPSLVAGSRLCSTEQMLIVMLYAFPIDCLMSILERGFRPWMMRILAVMVFFGVYITSRTGGFFHSYPYFELTRYNAAVEMTNHIIDTLPKQKFTIISTTDELYQVIEHGYHEELLSFIQQESDETYTIPTPYLLLYIEKHPIVYAQNHFADGPGWLAWKKYPEFYKETGSQCPNILSTSINTKSASEELYYGMKLSDSASDKDGRRILESRASQWYESFSAMHPRDCRVVYEDEDFMCCCITQNPGSLYSLGIMGGSDK